ncbi:MAG: hypothetical protein AAF761_11645 [Pseudomonadota bacterium]
MTLPCPTAGVRVDARPSQTWSLRQNRPVLTDDMCRRFLGALGVKTPLKLTIDVDLPLGAGCGMSTAALVALARAVGTDETRITGACIAVEGASDPTMLGVPDGVLWAPREGQTLGDIPPPPRAGIVGGLWGPPTRTDPEDANFPPIDDLVADWSSGPDVTRAAEIAAESARRTTALRGPKADPTEALARDLGALGFARAHTGSARAMIFLLGQVPDRAEDAMRRAGYAHVMRFQTGGRA